jgi:uncharacterized protein YecA (UPF0149 family)
LRDLNRSEQLLLEGLSVSEVRDFKDLAERLADLYEEQGRGEEAQGIRQRVRGSLPAIQHTLSELPNVAARLQVSSPQVTTSRQKVGRNDPCPCGSGKKFKKCCGG